MEIKTATDVIQFLQECIERLDELSRTQLDEQDIVYRLSVPLSIVNAWPQIEAVSRHDGLCINRSIRDIRTDDDDSIQLARYTLQTEIETLEHLLELRGEDPQKAVEYSPFLPPSEWMRLLEQAGRPCSPKTWQRLRRDHADEMIAENNRSVKISLRLLNNWGIERFGS